VELKDKVIAITGAGRGIGRTAAEYLARKGAKIAILDLDAEAMAEAVTAIKALGAEARAYVCNVTDEEVVESTFAQIVADFGGIHGLVNNAGILRDATLIKVKDGKVVKKMSADNFSLVVDVHMKGAFLCAREAATHMVEGGVEDGCIINMSSIARSGNFGQTNYSAAKAGLVSMARVWTKELGKFNIRSAAIAPGTIETDMLRSMPEEVLSGMANAVPLKRIGQPENIAQTIAFIFENDYVSGDCFDINGGFLI